MPAVDTNVIVRLLVGDEPQQYARARKVFAAGPVWLAKTVLLETVWVLDRVYGYSNSEISAAVTNLLGMKNVHVEDHHSTVEALAWFEQGLDFADSLHLTSRPHGTSFVSFDRKLVRRAARLQIANVKEP